MRLMQIRMAKRALTLGLAVVAFAAVALHAQGAEGQEAGPGMGPHRPPMERAMGPHGDHGRWWNEPHAIERLKLTDTQRKAMDDTYQQHLLTLVDLHATQEKAELEMEPLMQNDGPDEGRILAQIDRIAQARAELEKANARMLLGIRKQLTPEQWKLIQSERSERRSGMGPEGRRFHGKGGPGAGGPPAPTDGAEPVPPGEEE